MKLNYHADTGSFHSNPNDNHCVIRDIIKAEPFTPPKIISRELFHESNKHSTRESA